MHKIVLIACLSLAACASAPKNPPSPSLKAAKLTSPADNTQSVTQAQTRFDSWKANFINQAIDKGYNPQLVRSVIGSAILQKRALKSNNNQAEFVKPVWSYVQTAASAARLNGGRGKLAKTHRLFDQIEARYGVDRHILTAIWGLETSYGKVLGSYDAVNAAASFAFEGRRTAFGETQLYGILDMLTSGVVKRDQLKSSWAAAMGMTQFIPTTFRDNAVDFDNDGNKDLWGNAGDALASAANYLEKSGWQRGAPVFAEVTLPKGFDYQLSDGRKQFINQWEALGLRPAHGGVFAPAASMMNAKLYIPAGSKGPALLTFKNFDVIKRYNNSNSYAMGITVLAHDFEGKRSISTPWPSGDVALTRSQQKTLQAALTAQGFDTGGVDGLIGSNSRRAIRGWQAANGVTADGYVEASLYKKIVMAAGMTP